MDEKKVREAIELIKSKIRILEKLENYGSAIEERKKKHIGLYNTAIEALEKQLAKKVDAKDDYRDFNGNLLYYSGFCPDCGFVVKSNKNKCCPFCTQVLDW